MLYLRTLRRLRPAQLLALAKKRLLPYSKGVRVPATIRVREGVRWQSAATDGDLKWSADEFRFLNRRKSIDLQNIDWRACEQSKLWRYNLHYFDYLHSGGVDFDTKCRLIDRWIESNPPGTPDAWEPYPLSLGCVNWIKLFASQGAGFSPSTTQLRSLVSQTCWLENNLEFELRANHLLKNTKAMVFSGVYLGDKTGARQLENGLELLLQQCKEQISNDGGHFERSPMYHCIVLEDLLDVIDLQTSNAGVLPAGAVADISETISRAVTFLARILAGDGDIPLFNDSAFAIASRPGRLIARANTLLGGSPANSDGPGIVELPDSGFYGYRDGGDSILIDCGPFGPTCQPGHAHCSALGYELCLDGERLVVDTGVDRYEDDAFRLFTRSTAAHSTVRVDGADQSEIWRSFRVARRAEIVAAEMRAKQTTAALCSAAHMMVTQDSLEARYISERSLSNLVVATSCATLSQATAVIRWRVSFSYTPTSMSVRLMAAVSHYVVAASKWLSWTSWINAR